ncbi:MAG: universal stress protein [Chloroflexi bacterium]|nr:universal stress protein [Chloroflexota bacterium]
MFSRILVPLDGSKDGESVLIYVEDIAKRYESEVVLMQAVDMPASLLMADPAGAAIVDPRLIDKELQVESEEGAHYLDEIVHRLRSQGLKVSSNVRREAPAAAIRHLAREGNFDLVIMGTHDHSGLSRLMFGSVTDDTVHHVEVPILIVHSPKRR